MVKRILKFCSDQIRANAPHIKIPFRIVLVYTVVGSLWILLSDQLLGMMVHDQAVYVRISMYKGWMYVGTTAALLYILIFQDFMKIHQLNTELTDKNGDLMASNEEIRSLYEEMAASEEALHESFDELQEYRIRLEGTEERYRLVIQASQEGFWDYDVKTQKLDLSETYCRIFGFDYSDKKELENTLKDRIHPDDFEKVRWIFDSDIQVDDGPKTVEIRIMNRDGGYRWIQSNSIVVRDSEGRVVRIVGSDKDIHEQILQRERVEYYAFHDPSTGFHNRDYMLEKISYVRHSADNDLVGIGILVVTIQGIGRITSIYGQNIADIVHYQVGTAIQSIFWNSENICVLEKGRFGIFLESGWDRDALEVCVELLRERLKTPVSINRLEVQVSPSFGLAVPEAIPDEPEVFIQYAETACEYGIRNHMGTVVVPFETRMQAEKEYQGRIEHCMKRAVENGEFSLVYQPQYSRNPEKDPVGYEALIRWNNKELGNVSPAVFIPLAEAEGQITGIGEYVINETCRFIRTYLDTWQKPVRIAVNASFLELMDSHYIERLMGYVNQYGLKPEMLSIEITETAISKYLDAVIDNLRSLREHGFEIHLDDFGTGYSSLNHLGRLPVNLLKIDRSFVWELEESTRMRELTDLIIKVAHQLDMEVCAEGVETEAQFSLLRDMGCDIFQGFLLSKPRSGERLLELAGTH